jgi:hypothetical protein
VAFRSAAGGFVPDSPRKKTDKENRLHLSTFPGLEEAFGIMVSPGELATSDDCLVFIPRCR